MGSCFETSKLGCVSFELGNSANWLEFVGFEHFKK